VLRAPRHSVLRRAVIALVVLTVMSAGLSGPASAAPFLGVMADGPLVDGSVSFSHQAALMASEGVETVRVGFYWIQSQPFAPGTRIPPDLASDFENIGGVPTSFEATDVVVAACARYHLKVLPVVVQAPIWARVDPSKDWSPPADPDAYANYVAALAMRYGPTGSFWSDHPELPRAPIRFWQIWNEPAGGDRPNDPSIFWDDPAPFQDRYVSMLRAANEALASVDPEARVVLAGLFGRSWLSLQTIYDHQARDLFDVVAVHPFARSPRESLQVVRLVRSVMRRNGDRTLPLFVTELSWDSSEGRVSKTDLLGTTKEGQAKRLLRAFRLFAPARRKLRVQRIYWYTWMGRDSSSTSSFDYAGLLHLAPDGHISAKPAFIAFRRIARWLAAGAHAGQAPS
jgi:hypothetical protein